MKRLLSFLALLLVAVHCLAPTFSNWATTQTNPPPMTPAGVTGTTIYVSPLGNDSTGSRGTGLPFATLTAAVRAAQDHDTIQLLSGNYPLSSNTCGWPAHNLTIIPNGLVDINFATTNLDPLVGDSNDFYLQPADNLRVYPGIRFHAASTNGSAYVFFGSSTNCPSATNVTVSVDSSSADSDDVIFGSYAPQQVVLASCFFLGADDTFNVFAQWNTNSDITLVNDIFSPNQTNLFTYGPRRGISVNAAVHVHIFNCIVRDNALTGGTHNVGVELGSAPGVYCNINGIHFEDAGPGPYEDIDFPAQGNTNITVYALSTWTNKLQVFNGSGASVGYPADLKSGNFVGETYLVLNKSQDPLDSAGYAYGLWHSVDLGTNGTEVHTNEGNQTAANGGSAWYFQPDDLNASAPVPGAFGLIDAYFQGNGSGLTNFTLLTITNSATPYLSMAVSKTTTAAGWLSVSLQMTNGESCSLSNITTHFAINIEDVDPQTVIGSVVHTVNSGFMVKSNDTVVLTNTSTAQAAVTNCTLQALH